MKQIAGSSSLSLFCLRVCLLVYVMLAVISTFALAEVNKYERSKATYTTKKSDSIKNSEKSAISSRQHEHNKVDGGRNYSANESVMISGEKNSAALNRFLEDVLNAQNDLKWIDHATRHINRTRPDYPLAHTNQHSPVSVNTGDVLERADIGYGSRLRGKRGFDRNYETMWMLQKKKYGRESTHDVPQRVYLDNDVTFKRDADNVFYQSRGTLDRAVYEEGTMADQPLKDWIGKKNLHSSGDWSNSNENLKVTNGENTWLHDYESARENLNSDSSKDEKLHADHLEVVSLYDPIHVNDFTALRGSSIPIKNDKTRNVPLSLESLKKTVLKLRNSLMLSYKRRDIIPRESNWDEPRSTVEIYGFGEDLDDQFNKKFDKETMQRLKRAKNEDNEDENNSKIFQGVEVGESYFGKHNSQESHNRSKRSRSFVTDSNYTNQRDIPENNSYRKTQMIKDVLKNVTSTQNTEEVVTKLYSSYLSDDGKKSANASNKMNISDLQYSLEKGFFSNNHINNLTIIPSIANKINIPERKLKYSSHTELYLNDHFIDNKSSFDIKMDFQTHSPERITKNEVPKTSTKEISQRFTSEAILKTIDHIAENRTNSSDFKKNAFTDSIDLSLNDGADDSGKSLKNRSDEEKLGVATQKISRLSTDDGQSKGAEKEFPRGNTSHGLGIGTNESRSCVVETIVAVRERETVADGTRKQNREPIPGVIKIFEPRGRSYQKREAESMARLSRRMGRDETSAAKMKTNEDEVDESRDTNVGDDSSTSPIDSVTDATTKPEAAYINTSEIGKSIIPKDLTLTTVDNDLQKQQQMVSPLSEAENRNANKSNGNLNRINIRVFGSNGNETMNVKEDARIDAESGDSSIKGTGSVFNIATESYIENVTSENRQPSKTTDSANLGNILTRIKREDKAEENRMLQDALNSQIFETNHARYKRSVYPYENLESNNEAENTAVEKEAALNYDEKQESNEEYLNQNVEEPKDLYNDIEENIFEDNDKAVESKREGQSLFSKQIDPVRAKVDMMIKQKLGKKRKGSSTYRTKRHNTLDVVEYYDYDEEQERDAPINEQEVQNKDNELLINAKIKRDDKPPGLGKKKNENAEAIMKEKRRKAQAKNKEPKEEIIVDLGERSKNKTAKNNKKSLSSLGSSFENVSNEKRQLLTKENSEEIHQSKDFANNVHHEKLAAAKLKWLDQPFEDRTASSKNSESLLEDSCKKKSSSNEPLEHISYANVNPDVIENILLNIQPIEEIMEESRELGASNGFYEDPEDDRSEDHYYYQDNDSNNVESLYEELKSVYDWPDGELKSRPRLRGDQRLRYESDDTLDTNPFQLQPLNDRFLSSGQNDNAQRRFQSIDASRMSGFEQSSTKENSPSIFSVRTTAKPKVSMISEDKNIPFTERRSIIDTDSGSPYENTKYVESKTDELLKRNLNLEKQAAISPQDLRESFVESLDWHDDVDDDVKVRLGRGLKAINDTEISGLNKTYKSYYQDKLNVNNATTSQTFRDNSSTLQNWYNNTIADLLNIFNHHGVSDRTAKNVQESILMNTDNMDGDEDLEAAEQKYVNNKTPRIRRAAVSYRTFYNDDVSQNQRDFDEMSRRLGNQFHSPNILQNQFNGVYDGHEIGNWNNDVQGLDRYSKIRRTNTRKKEKPGKRSKKIKHSLGKHAKKNSLHSSSNRNRRHHAHQSDVSRNVNRNDLKPKQKNKAEASPLIGRTRIQKGKTAEQELLRAGINEVPGEKVLYENAEDQSTVKPEEDDARRKEITLLLAADNVDDESQMDVALHGELAGKIVEQIFEQVQKNDQLKSVFGPGLHRDHKMEDKITGNIYRQGLDENGKNHTEMMIKKVMGLLGTLILNEVQKKTCITLSPDMREFLGWMLEMDREKKLSEEAPLLPLVREKIIPEQDTARKFLFDSTFKREIEENINELQKKVRVLETLVKEYNALTAKEKTKVQAVHDYLIQQLNLLLQYIEARENAETKGKPTSVFVGAARAGTGNILQYQSAVPNATNASHSMTKDAFSLPIDTHNLFRFNNSFEMTDKQLHHSHRKTRSLDKIPSERRRKTSKRQKLRNQKKKENHRQSKRRRNKHRKYLLERVESSPGYRKSRQKRANPENDRASLYYLGYEKPRIYESFNLLDAKLTGKKKKKRKRELIDKKNAATENDRVLDFLPIKGKNRMEDEVILLNKREAWKRENEEQLEEVAFGKDMRNSTRRERERFEKLTEGDKRRPFNETSFRTKREDIIRGTSTGESYTDRFNKSHAALEMRDGESRNNSEMRSNDNGAKSENKLELAEREINVFADNSRSTDAAIDSVAAEVSAEEKLATNAVANNQVKGKLRAVNRETKIDKANGSTSFVNLTRDAEPRVSEERQKVSVTEKEADDNAVKLNRATNYRREEIDPEIELENLRQGRERRIYDVANWKISDYDYDDDNLSRNKLREKYVTKLDELGDLDTDPENNLALLRLRNNKWSDDVVEWKLLPIIKRSPYYDDRAVSGIRLMEKETPILSNVQSQSNAYLNSPKFWRLQRGRDRDSVFNILPVPKITDNDNFPRRIHRKARRASERATFKEDPKIILKDQRLPRSWSNKRSNGIAEFGMPFVLKDPNRDFREMLRSRNHPELGDRVINDAVGLQLPIQYWPYQYYDDFADSSTFHFAPGVHGRGNDVYRYPAETYLEYGPFRKRRAHDASRRFARRNRFRLRTSEGEDAVDFPRDNLANKSSESRFAQGKFRAETNEPALASGEDCFTSGETKDTEKNARKTNETKTKSTEYTRSLINGQ
ncbi:PREDICTED: uncharacterized protein LOC105456502 isoform X2 [Wasmannia auropunctata]|uniref:uncharacterized protein LOC105456502 isoform X2 n=1 Tax=Wasmannia auropunctata TaxID=64793 RepID=UPI0005F035C6|nr:PREDICTED: uncharacterized protein LOC105456502 isoform X2 [Wasmannia auropunctata]